MRAGSSPAARTNWGLARCSQAKLNWIWRSGWSGVSGAKPSQMVLDCGIALLKLLLLCSSPNCSAPAVIALLKS